MPGKEVLRTPHARLGKEGRGSDRTLSLLEVPSSDQSTQLVALHSRIQSVVDVSGHTARPEEPTRLIIGHQQIPGLWSRDVGSAARSGLAFVPLESSDDESDISRWLMLEASTDGELRQKTIQMGKGQDSDEVTELEPVQELTVNADQVDAPPARIQHLRTLGCTVESALTRGMDLRKVSRALRQVVINACNQENAIEGFEDWRRKLEAILGYLNDPAAARGADAGIITL